MLNGLLFGTQKKLLAASLRSINQHLENEASLAQIDQSPTLLKASCNPSQFRQKVGSKVPKYKEKMDCHECREALNALSETQ